jgi:hypothetical protein
MNWKKIIKMPPRPYEAGKIYEWEQPVSEYGLPRALGASKGKHMSEGTFKKEIKPLVTWNPYTSIQNAEDNVSTSVIHDLERGNTVTMREIQSELMREGPEATHTSIKQFKDINTEFFNIYEQMLDDLYDQFEVWKAFTSWRKFTQEYHKEEHDGDGDWRSRSKYGEFSNDYKLEFIQKELELLSKNVDLAKTNSFYNKSELLTTMINNVESGINKVLGLIGNYEQ